MGDVLSFGVSKSVSRSEQEAQANLTQTYQGSCDITCDNIISGAHIAVINSDIGGNISLTQSCSVNGQCLFTDTMDATADVSFAATNSTNAKNAAPPLSVGSANVDTAESDSRQDINENITQAVTQNCNMTSSNDMNDITILAVNSTIGGGIELGQTNKTTANCVLDATLSAATMASATAENAAQSGKDKKGGSIGSILVIVGVVVLLVVLGFAAKYMGKKKEEKAADERYHEAKERGCKEPGSWKFWVTEKCPPHGKHVLKGSKSAKNCKLKTQAQCGAEGCKWHSNDKQCVEKSCAIM